MPPLPGDPAAPEFPASLRANGSVKFGSYCPPCQKAYQHEWYLANRDKHRAAAAARRQSQTPNGVPVPPTIERRPLREAVGFRAHTNTRLQGDAGMGIAIAYFSRIGVRIGIPLTDSQPYDLMIDNGGSLARVQVRTTTVKEGRSYVVGLKTVGGNKTQIITKVFEPSAYEWLFVVSGTRPRTSYRRRPSTPGTAFSSAGTTNGSDSRTESG